MALSDMQIRKAKPADKDYKLPDAGGMYLLVRSTGTNSFMLKYRFGGSEKKLTLGRYPHVSLKDARNRRDEAKKLLAAGIDPNEDKKRKAFEATVAANNTFKAIAEQFIAKLVAEERAEMTLKKNRWFLELLTPELGKRPISEIKPLEVLTVVKKIEAKGNRETAKRTRAFASRVFQFAVVSGLADVDPAASVGKALVAPKVKHHAAIIEPTQLGQLLRDIDRYTGGASTKLALQLAPHVFVRPGELRKAEWDEFDLDKAVWAIPAAKMKMRSDHRVPLSRQALEILAQASQFRGHGKYVFPTRKTWLEPMSENTLNQALRRMGYSSDEMTSHGFRSTASTLLNETGLWSSDAIEHALAHKDRNNVRAIYDRGTRWEERVKMAQWWSDYLDQLKNGADVINMERRA